MIPSCALFARCGQSGDLEGNDMRVRQGRAAGCAMAAIPQSEPAWTTRRTEEGGARDCSKAETKRMPDTDHIIERVPGYIRQAAGFRQFLRRGIDNSPGGWATIRTVHKLPRSTNMFRRGTLLDCDRIYYCRLRPPVRTSARHARTEYPCRKSIRMPAAPGRIYLPIRPPEAATACAAKSPGFADTDIWQLLSAPTACAG